jgi:hypothetical protein
MASPLTFQTSYAGGGEGDCGEFVGGDGVAELFEELGDHVFAARGASLAQDDEGDFAVFGGRRRRDVSRRTRGGLRGRAFRGFGGGGPTPAGVAYSLVRCGCDYSLLNETSKRRVRQQIRPTALPVT